MQVDTQCCIAGGGPAGIMLGYLLARAGIDVTVLEKWPDFFRDFRGDTIHPSTMELLRELGLLERFLALPHQEAAQLSAYFNDEKITLADFSHLRVSAPYVAFVPQWDFLNFIAEAAHSYPHFHLLMETEATDLIETDGRVTGVRATGPDGALEIRADLVVGADGRHSTVRARSGLASVSEGVPIDVLWFSLPRSPGDVELTLGHVRAGQFLVMIDRDSYWQCGYVIPKGKFTALQTQGIESFRRDLKRLIGFEDDRLRALQNWEDIKLLSVTVDHLPRWYRPGLLCIGDAAHAMSPIGGVGINLAIQDAAAAARILAPALKAGEVDEGTLRAVQKRRAFPARLIQRIQVFLQDQVIARILTAPELHQPPLLLRLVRRFPRLRRIPAYLIGMGIRPEHVGS